MIPSWAPGQRSSRAELTGHACHAIELNPAYVDVFCQKMGKLHGQPGGARGPWLTACQARRWPPLLDLDERTIRKFAVSGIMVRAGKGEYALGPSVRNYVRHLREAAAGRQGVDARLNVVDESALLRREQRRNFELKNAILASAAVPGRCD